MPLLCEKVDCITYVVKEMHDPKLMLKSFVEKETKKDKANKSTA